MKNEAEWVPSWLVLRNRSATVTSDTSELFVASRLAATLGLKAWDGLFRDYARGRLLDLACGKVPFYEVYRPFVEDITCVDWGNSAHGNRYVDCLCDLNEALPFADEEYDTILIASALEHVARPEVAWREAARVLKPGGHLLVSVPFFYWVHEPPYDYYRYTEFALRRFCEENGLEVVEFRTTGGAPEVLFDVASRALALVPRVGVSAAAGMQRIGLLAVQLWPLSKVSRRTRALFPLAYILVARKELTA